LALQDESRGHGNIHFMTLVDLARRFCSDHLLKQGLLEPAALLPEFILEEVVGAALSGGYFSGLKEKGILEPCLLSAMTDLKESCITPEELRQWSSRSRLSKEGGDKIEELARFYSDYDKRFRAIGLVDRNDILQQASALIPASNETSLFVYGYYDFNPLQKKFMAALLQQQQVLLFFPWREGTAFEYALPTLNWLKSLKCEHVALNSTDDNELAVVASRLFEPAKTKAVDRPLHGRISLVSAPGEGREVSEIAREILRWVERDGLKFSDIGILLRGTEPYVPLLAEAFSRLQIPYYLHAGRPLWTTRTGQSANLLLRIVKENFSRSTVMEFITYAPIDFRRLMNDSEDEPDIALWDFFSTEAGIVARTNEWNARLERLRRRTEKQQRTRGDWDERMQAHRVTSLAQFQQFVRHLFGSLMTLPNRGRWSDLADGFSNLLRAILTPAPETERVTAEINGLAWLDLLNEQIDLERFSRAVELTLNSARESSDGFGKGKVFIGDIMSARGLVFRAVVVPGMVEKMFPRSWRQDPILLDHERQYISEGLGKELVQKSRQFDEERLLFVLTVMAARERILLTYPRLEVLTGRERIPSFFLLRLMEAVNGRAASFSNFDEWKLHRRVPLSRFFPADGNDALDILEYDLLQADRVVSGTNRSSLNYLPALSPFFNSGLVSEAARWGQKIFTNYDGVLEDLWSRTHLDRRFGNRTTFSPTALECYARCPFRFFIEYLLRVRATEEPDPFALLSPQDRGSLVHQILFLFLDKLKREELLPMTRERENPLEVSLIDIADQVFAQYEKEEVTGFELLWQLEKEKLTADLRSWLQAELAEAGTFVPARFEQEFLCSFPLNGEAVVQIRGRIDRVDVSQPDRTARILDYKTGRPRRLKDGEFKGGEALQLPLYLYASRELLDEATTEASYYYVSRNGKFQKDRFTRDSWDKKLETLARILAGLVGEIRRGLFIARPPSCGECPYPWICTPAAGVLFERKRRDRRIETFESIKGIV